MKILILAGILASPLMAGTLGGPLPGFVLDPRSGSIRPVMGMPGAMQLGAAVPLPFQAVSAEFDPNGGFAVVISNEQPGHLYVIQNLSNATVIDMGAVADKSTVLGINNTGQTAVLSAPGQLQFLTGMAGTPVLAEALATQSLLGPISAGIVDAAGQCALLGTSSGQTGAFETFCQDGASQRIFSQAGMQITAITLANQGQDAIVADSGGQQILRIANYSQSSATSVLGSINDGLNNPIGVQVNGQQMIVADAGASAVFLFDLSGQNSTQTIQLGSAPVRLKALGNQTVLLLNDPSAVPFNIFSLQTMQPFFIPTN